MTVSTNVFLQILGVLIASLTVLSGALKPATAAIVVAVIGVLKAAQSAYAQRFNTNGTPQEVPGGKAAEKQ